MSNGAKRDLRNSLRREIQAREAERKAYPPAPRDWHADRDQAKHITRLAAELCAAMHIGQGRVMVCEQAFAARFLDPAARDDNEPLKIAALLGVIMAFDQQGQGRAA